MLNQVICLQATWRSPSTLTSHWSKPVRYELFHVHKQNWLLNSFFFCSFVAAELLSDLEGAFQEKIDVAYFDTSKYLLDVLNRNYLLLEHLQAMRRYLLLGQGDFIRHLMDLLKLAEPANRFKKKKKVPHLVGNKCFDFQARVGASRHHFVPAQPDWDFGDSSQSHQRPVW